MWEYLEPSWKNLLHDSISGKNMKKLTTYVAQEYARHSVHPTQSNIFKAFSLTPFNQVHVIIIGQDPYHNPGQAQGLCFSVPENMTPPPSLKNIYKEINNDLGIQKDMHNGDLSDWAHQGVLLLNSILTVRESEPGSHGNQGWELFTDSIIQKISEVKEHCVFILWGNYAQKKISLIDQSKHLILTSTHPSPLSAYRGFFGNKHFSQTNTYLMLHGKNQIRW